MVTKIKDVFVIRESASERTTWVRVGVAFVNKDDSLNVILDAVPLSGKLHIRDRLKTEVPDDKK